MYIRIRRKVPGTLSDRSRFEYVNHPTVRDGGSFLLLETGDTLLQEDGVSVLFLENG